MKKIKLCPICKKHFELFKQYKYKTQIYCSRTCSYKSPERNKKLFYWLGRKRPKKTRIKISKSLEGKRGCLSRNWKGGRLICSDGYILLHKPEHPCSSKRDGYVREHRLVVEKHLGRYLTKKEIVHHINSNILDNRIQNLMAFNGVGNHARFEFGKKVKPENIIFDGRKIKEINNDTTTKTCIIV